MRSAAEITSRGLVLHHQNREGRATGIRIVVPPKSRTMMPFAPLSPFAHTATAHALAKTRRRDYVLRVRRSHIAVVHLAAFAACCALLPCVVVAQSSACSEGQSVLWSQVPEQNWPATQSLLEEIQSVDSASSKSAELEEPLTLELPLSVDPLAERLLDTLKANDGPAAAPEKPGICFTELDPSCVQDPGSSSTTSVQHVERCGSLDDDILVESQPRTASLVYPPANRTVGPNGVRSKLERPPAG